MKKFLIPLIFMTAPAYLNAQQVMTISNPKLISMKLEKISPALRDIPESSADELLNGKRLEREDPSLENPMPLLNRDALPTGTDPALQTNYTGPYGKFITTTILSNWEGLAAPVEPSDNTIAVGPNHVFQITNNNVSSYMRIWDKSGNILVNKKKVMDLTGINDFGDPSILYDEEANRYVFVLLYSFSANKLLVCVSQTSDPTGAYYVYSFDTEGGYPDYPKIALFKSDYFITTSSNSPSIFALKRNSMLRGKPMATVQKFTLTDFPSVGFEAASPVMQTGPLAPPTKTRAVMIRMADDAWGPGVGSDHLELFELRIDWFNSANSTITGPVKLSTIAYNSNLCGFNTVSCIPQPDTNTKLDPLGNIIMDKVQYRNFGTYASIVCSHVCNVDGNGTAGIRWYELRKVGNSHWFIYQQGTYSPDADYRFMSSISINQSGQIALGYNISSSMVYPGIRITGRDTCDIRNEMAVPETIIKEGASENGVNWYGDYNGMVADPTDGSFWFTGNYNVTPEWSTNVVHFTFDPCQFRLSAPISVINDLKAVPNPATDEVEISFQSSMEQNIPVQIIDMAGKTVLQETEEVTSGYNSILLDLHGLENGYYIVKVSTERGNAIQRLVIQR